MPPLDVCLRNADELAEEIVNAWAVNVDAGNANICLQSSTLCLKRHVVIGTSKTWLTITGNSTC